MNTSGIPIIEDVDTAEDQEEEASGASTGVSDGLPAHAVAEEEGSTEEQEDVLWLGQPS